MGNLDAKRDWGFAGDYVRAMWLMLQQDKPDDYVVATGETYSVREFLEMAFAHARPRLPATSSSSTPGTPGPPRSTSCSATRRKAKQKLGWKPEVDFHGLVKMMVEHDLELARREKFAQGYQTV